jgi:hypothetical protein
MGRRSSPEPGWQASQGVAGHRQAVLPYEDGVMNYSNSRFAILKCLREIVKFARLDRSIEAET